MNESWVRMETFCLSCLWLMIIQMDSLLMLVMKPISIANLRLANKRRRPENPVYPEKEYLAICIIKT